MPLHIVKLCVGIDRVDQLTQWGREERGRNGAPIVHTRQTPKRAGEVLEGGSLYWVIKGVILCRQTIVDIRTIEDGPRPRCEIELDDLVVATAPQPRRAFQGWRYFLPKDAPADLSRIEAGDVPAELVQELRAIGAW